MMSSVNNTDSTRVSSTIAVQIIHLLTILPTLALSTNVHSLLPNQEISIHCSQNTTSLNHQIHQQKYIYFQCMKKHYSLSSQPYARKKLVLSSTLVDNQTMHMLQL